MNQEGRPRGIAHVDFENLDSAVAAVESSQQEAIHVGGRDLRLDFSDGQKGKAANPPNVKLYFQGCSGDESDIRTIFQQFSNSIVDIHLCMLFTLSDFLLNLRGQY
jgi:RNA recognition motif-containing protein